MSRMTSLLVFTLWLMVPTVATAEDGDAALMKACPGVAAWVTDHRHAAEAAAKSDAIRPVSEPILRSELARRSANDQRAREALIAAVGSRGAAGKNAAAVDRANLQWLKAVIDEQGFPTIHQVGASGFRDAWLLVQHADSYPTFQAAVLKALKPLLATGEMHGQEFAMLTDRVMRGQGRPQRYATQFRPAKDGSFVLEPTEDMTGLADRREAMGLMPLPAYRCMLRFTYSTPTKVP